MSPKTNKSLIEVLNACAAECNHCAAACLDEQDIMMLARCVKLDLDCAGICQLTSSLLARGSEHGLHLLEECAEICNACAKECEKHASKMDHCKACAEMCRKCASECSAAA
jgi:hypothetical protein